MIKSSYTKEYLKLYFWQIASLLLTFTSVFVVYPYLTKVPNLFGIYTLCSSLSIFLSYADLGFLSAGQKFASEYFAQKKYDDEVKVIGFTSFILFLVLIIFGITFIILSTNPELVLNKTASQIEKNIASKILLILAISVPINLLQRTSNLIFSVRLKDYLIQRINVIGNILKICSVLLFFGENKYLIVEYFIFTQFINFFSSIISMYLAKKNFNFNTKLLFHSFKFNNAIFIDTKKIAFASLYTTFFWIFYYELDSIVINKYLGSNSLAIFSVGLTILSFYRNILGMVFSPFTSRFNHFIGQANISELKQFYFNIVIFFSGLVVIPIATIFLFASPLISSWIGENYSESIKIVKILTLCNVMSFITYPTNIMLIAQSKLKYIYIITTFNTFLYWIFIVLTFKTLGVESFAYSKLATFLISGFWYLFILLKIMRINIFDLLSRIFFPLLPPILLLLLASHFSIHLFSFQKSRIGLIINATLLVLFIFTSLIFYYFINKGFKKQLNLLLKKLNN